MNFYLKGKLNPPKSWTSCLPEEATIALVYSFLRRGPNSVIYIRGMEGDGKAYKTFYCPIFLHPVIMTPTELIAAYGRENVLFFYKSI